MTLLPVRVSDEADADITDAARWYAQRSHKVALGFIEAVYNEFGYIAQFPRGAPRLKGSVRQLPVSGFPFVVLYQPMRDHIAVVRVFHTSQHPKKKLKGKG